MKRLRVVFAARVEHAHGLYQLSLRNAAAVVAHGYAQVVFQIHLDTLAGLHLKLVDRVVNHLFQQYVNAVFGLCSVAKSADVHTRARANVLHVRQVPDVIVGVCRLVVGLLGGCGRVVCVRTCRVGWLKCHLLLIIRCLFLIHLLLWCLLIGSFIWCAPALERLDVALPTFVNASIQPFPLALHFRVGFHLHLCFSPFKSVLLVARNKVGEEQRVDAFHAIFG